MTQRRSPQGAPGPNFDLHIGELVMDGYAPGEGRIIATALEQELGRLLAEGSPPFAEGSGRRTGEFAFDRLDAGTVTHPPGASPQAVGRSTAQAIVQALRALSTGAVERPAQQLARGRPDAPRRTQGDAASEDSP